MIGVMRINKETHERRAKAKRHLNGEASAFCVHWLRSDSTLALLVPSINRETASAPEEANAQKMRNKLSLASVAVADATVASPARLFDWLA